MHSPDNLIAEIDLLALLNLSNYGQKWMDILEVEGNFLDFLILW